MSLFDWIRDGLRDLEQQGLRRQPGDGALREAVRKRATEAGEVFVDASSNDYLGYGRRVLGLDGYPGGAAEVLGQAADTNVSRETNPPGSGCGLPAWQTAPTAGACSSRLLGGTRAEHCELETAIADWVRQESALLFSSGYAANVGVVSGLATREDVIFSDELNHASIVDGCRLSRASVVIYPHLDLQSLRELLARTPVRGRRFIVTESYFSMDGDSPDLVRLRALATEFGAALLVDEAHALGVFGPSGAGLAAACAVQPDLTIGTLGKAIGLQGAFVAAPELVKHWLWNRARSFVYSTASVPLLARLALLHVKQVQSDDTGRVLLGQRSSQLRCRIQALGFPMPIGSHGPIVPVILRQNEAAACAAESLRSRGILAYPLRPPTVPEGSARLRLTVSAGMTAREFDRLLMAASSALQPFAAAVTTDPSP